MKFTAAQTQKIMFALRCTAEKDPNDVIANSASQLAFELEYPQRVNRLTETDISLIQYAFKKSYTPTRVNA
jgi:hypothetical protein